MTAATHRDLPRDLKLQRPVRPRELQDPLNLYLYHPLAWRLTMVLARTPLTPNMVSVIGACFVLGAAVAYALPYWPGSAFLGMALHMTWHVVDGADGDLARVTGRASPKGEAIDGLCDYAGHFALYLVLGWILNRQIGHVAWVITIAAGISHILQANHVEVQRRQYQWWVYGVPWLRNSSKSSKMQPRGVLGGLVSAYLRVGSAMTPYALNIDNAITYANARDGTELEQIRCVVRTEARPLLRLCKILGPNPRAILLSLSMLAGSPVYYLCYQIALLSLLAFSIVWHNHMARRIAERINAPIPSNECA